MSFIRFFVVLVLYFFVFLPIPVFAQEKIDSFDTSIVAHKDGTMTVTENILYDFGADSRHGIFRTIPRVSRVGDLYRIIEIDFLKTLRDGEDETYEIENRSKESEIKIGDADKTISGKHNYIIIYRVKNGIGSNYETHDEIYWNATGNEWEIPIERASLRISTDFGINPLESICFTGPASSKFQNCQVNGNSISTTDILNPYQGLTTVTKFPVNTFPKSELRTSEPVFDPDFLNLLKFYIPILLVLNILVGPYLLFWYFKNHSKKRLGSPAVNFDIPKNISPLEAGIIDNAKLEKNDVIATIFDLAIRKYLKIEEVKIAKTLRPDETDYKVIKLKDSEGLNSFEAALFSRLFRDGNEIKLEDLKTDFYSTFATLEKKAFGFIV